MASEKAKEVAKKLFLNTAKAVEIEKVAESYDQFAKDRIAELRVISIWDAAEMCNTSFKQGQREVWQENKCGIGLVDCIRRDIEKKNDIESALKTLGDLEKLLLGDL